MTQLSDDILRLRAEGKTYNQIKEILGCSKGTISHHLGAGQKEKTAIRRKKTRDRHHILLLEYKEKQGCIDCGENYPHYILEFDHKPEFEKSGIVYKILCDKGLDAAWEEIAKCDVVCANCHKLRTYLRKPWGKPLT